MYRYDVRFYREGQKVPTKNRIVEAANEAEAIKTARLELGIADDSLRAGPHNLGALPLAAAQESATAGPEPKEAAIPEAAPAADASKTVAKTVDVVTNGDESPKAVQKKKG